MSTHVRSSIYATTNIAKPFTTSDLSLGSCNSQKEKFNFEIWKEKPESIPTGSSYYLHDNRAREEMTFWERRQYTLATGRSPRSRPPLRGRGAPLRRSDPRPIRIGRVEAPARPFRGGFTGRRTVAEMEWKHDKFSEIEDDAESDKKPAVKVQIKKTITLNKDKGNREVKSMDDRKVDRESNADREQRHTDRTEKDNDTRESNADREHRHTDIRERDRDTRERKSDREQRPTDRREKDKRESNTDREHRHTDRREKDKDTRGVGREERNKDKDKVDRKDRSRDKGDKSKSEKGKDRDDKHRREKDENSKSRKDKDSKHDKKKSSTKEDTKKTSADSTKTVKKKSADSTEKDIKEKTEGKAGDDEADINNAGPNFSNLLTLT